MKIKARALFPIIGASLVLLAALAWFYLPSNELSHAVPAGAEAVDVRGKAERLMSAGTVAGELSRGDRLTAGEGIRTDKNSAVTLKFDDDSMLLIGEESQVTLDTLLRSSSSGQTETLIRVDEGAIESRVNRQSGFEARYKVVTPALQLAVRGTVFRVTVNKQTGLASSSVIEGVVEASAEGKTVLLESGFATSASPGQPPSEPRKMPDAPELIQLASLEAQIPLNLQWDKVQGAAAYRVQLLVGDRAEMIAYEGRYENNSALITGIEDGEYTLKVQAISGEGIDGQVSQQRFELDAHPLAPGVKSPTDGAVSSRSKTRFFWEPSAEATTYLFQISDSDRFETIISEVSQLPGEMQGISVKLQSGQYFWRIASIDNDNEQGPFTDPQAFVVKRK